MMGPLYVNKTFNKLPDLNHFIMLDAFRNSYHSTKLEVKKYRGVVRLKP